MALEMGYGRLEMALPESAEPDHIRRRRGEPHEAHMVRLHAMHQASLQRAREAFDVAEAARRAAGRPSGFGPKILPPLPAPEQVTGWSRADPAKTPHHPERALFGGWRLGDLED